MATPSNIKCVMVGDGAAGKGYAATKYVTGVTRTDYIPTIFDNWYKNMRTPENEEVQLGLWDTAGQDDFDKHRPLSYPGSDVILIAVSLTSLTTLHNVRKKWVPEVRHYLPDVPIVLAGTKTDIWEPEKNKSHVTMKMMKDLAIKIGAVDVCLCSTYSNQGIEHLFTNVLNSGLKYRFSVKKEKRYNFQHSNWDLRRAMQNIFHKEKERSLPFYESEGTFVYTMLDSKNDEHCLEVFQSFPLQKFYFQKFYQDTGNSVLQYTLNRKFLSAARNILDLYKVQKRI